MYHLVARTFEKKCIPYIPRSVWSLLPLFTRKNNMYTEYVDICTKHTCRVVHKGKNVYLTVRRTVQSVLIIEKIHHWKKNKAHKI